MTIEGEFNGDRYLFVRQPPAKDGIARYWVYRDGSSDIYTIHSFRPMTCECGDYEMRHRDTANKCKHIEAFYHLRKGVGDDTRAG